MRGVIVRTLPLLLTLAACARLEPVAEDGDRPVRFVISGAGAPDSRSVLSASAEDRITSVTLLFYKNEVLEKVVSFAGPSGTVTFSDDEKRSVFALVNMASVKETDIPLRMDDLKNLTWRLTSYAAMERDGLPMADSISFRPSDRECGISVKRLVSRFSFSLSDEYRSFGGGADEYDSDPDPADLFKDMTYTLKNINGTLRPFGASVAGPGDLLADREFELTRDGTAILYVPENLQGDLLNVSDPSEKTMDALKKRYGAGNEPCATYVEVTLQHDPAEFGIGGKLTYRFFLGENNTTNFSVGRNLDYKVRFGPVYDTVLHCFDTKAWTWKIESNDWSDTRYLYTDNGMYLVQQGGEVSIVVVYGYGGVHHPEKGDDPWSTGCHWRAYVKSHDRYGEELVHYPEYEGFREVSYDPVGGLLRFRLQNSLPVGTLIDVVLMTLDGRHEGKVQIRVEPPYNMS